MTRPRVGAACGVAYVAGFAAALTAATPAILFIGIFVGLLSLVIFMMAAW